MNNIGFFTVVIPSYKRVYELVRAVESALSQGELVEEVIVVDDCSENIDEISSALAELKSNKIVVIKNEFKSNAAQTRNQGAKLAKTEWVLLLDSDDSFLDGKLEAIKAEIDKNENNKVVYYNRAQIWFDGKLEKVVPSRPLSQSEDISDYLFTDSEIMQTSTLAVPQSFFVETGFNEHYSRHQDYDLCLSLYRSGYEFKFVTIQGTAIYWGSDTRPTDKGESAEYSRTWAIENTHRMTSNAFNNFYFYFVVLKLLRSGQKIRALRELKAIDTASISVKKKLFFISLVAIPSFFMNSAYLLYKKMTTKLADKNSGKN